MTAQAPPAYGALPGSLGVAGALAIAPDGLLYVGASDAVVRVKLP